MRSFLTWPRVCLLAPIVITVSFVTGCHSSRPEPSSAPDSAAVTSGNDAVQPSSTIAPQAASNHASGDETATSKELQPASTNTKSKTSQNSKTSKPSKDSAAKPDPKWLGAVPAKAGANAKPVVLFDSYHAHNFIHRGLVPNEHTYHRFTGLRRAAKLLESRGCEVHEMLVGPITAKHLANVQLLVINLPSMDRPPWLVTEIAAIEQFVRRGGGILFVTDHSNCYYHQYQLLPLWDRLGLIPTFETVCERKPNCMLTPTGAGWVLIRDFKPHAVTNNVRYCATQTGGRVVGEGVIAWTSDQAWADAGVVPLYGEGSPGLFGDMRLSDSEQQGAQGVLLARAVDHGRVVVISDQNMIGDAFITYADNWLLWLNACRWCGNLSWKEDSFTAHTTSNSVAKTSEANQPRSANESATDANEPTNFEKLIADEPDRNAMPRIDTAQWHIHCWEPLQSEENGKFYFGGGDLEQYYNFWCWLNRWFWATASDRDFRPAESRQGRPLLIAMTSSMDSSELLKQCSDTLKAQGKVVLISDSDLSIDDATTEKELASATQTIGRAAQDDIKSDAIRFRAEPIPHWRLESDKHRGQVVLITNAERIRNSRFPRPESAPNAVALKNQNTLLHWLLERP